MRRAWPRCPWATAVPERHTQRHSAAGVEGAAGAECARGPGGDDRGVHGRRQGLAATHHAPAPPVRRAPEGVAAVSVGGGRAWPGFEPTRRAEGSQRGRRAGGPPPSGAESSWGGGPPPSGTEKGHQHCAVTIGNGDPTHQQHGHQCPHERSSHVHNAEACITNLFHVINFQCIHSYDI